MRTNPSEMRKWKTFWSVVRSNVDWFNPYTFVLACNIANSCPFIISGLVFYTYRLVRASHNWVLMHFELCSLIMAATSEQFHRHFTELRLFCRKKTVAWSTGGVTKWIQFRNSVLCFPRFRQFHNLVSHIAEHKHVYCGYHESFRQHDCCAIVAGTYTHTLVALHSNWLTAECAYWNGRCYDTWRVPWHKISRYCWQPIFLPASLPSKIKFIGNLFYLRIRFLTRWSDLLGRVSHHPTHHKRATKSGRNRAIQHEKIRKLGALVQMNFSEMCIVQTFTAFWFIELRESGCIHSQCIHLR